jgi:hypothetical protein
MTSTLTEAQRSQVAAWLAEGQKLSEIQKRLEAEFGLRLTYMEVKLLLGDLQLMPKDQEPPKPADLGVLGTAKGSPQPTATGSPAAKPPPAPPAGSAPGTVSVSVDQITRPGAMVSGKVTFGDGQKGVWYVDQMGRLALAPEQKGYRPSAADMREFQVALDQELARMGL